MIVSIGIIIVGLLNLSFGCFLVIFPALAIEMQRIFYAQINWRVEPISMPKELRNTRIMGVFLIVFSVFFGFVWFLSLRKLFIHPAV